MRVLIRARLRPCCVPAAGLKDGPPLPPSSVVAAPKTSKVDDETSAPTKDPVDPFRIGYNLGMQTVHLETLRSKLDDNLELLKSHFNGLREHTRTNYDAVRRAHEESTKLILDDQREVMEKIRAHLEGSEVRAQRSEETFRQLTWQQFESLQKHTDDRLENIKDTVKVLGVVLVALNVWILITLNYSTSRYHDTGAHHMTPAKHHAHHQAPPLTTATTEQQPKTGWWSRLFQLS